MVPALAMPAVPSYGNQKRRHLSVLLDTSLHRPALCEAWADLVEARGNGELEICLCVPFPIARDTARMIERLLDRATWIRVVRAERLSDNAIVAQWTVAQATGRVLLLGGRGHTLPTSGSPSALDTLRDQVTCDTAICMVQSADVLEPESYSARDEFWMLLVRKSVYLTIPHRAFSLDAAVVAVCLETLGHSVSRRSV